MKKIVVLLLLVVALSGCLTGTNIKGQSFSGQDVNELEQSINNLQSSVSDAMQASRVSLESNRKLMITILVVSLFFMLISFMLILKVSRQLNREQE